MYKGLVDMQCLVRIAFVILACSVTSMGFAYEYSQPTIDTYMSACTIGDFFSQARCECAIEEIQQSISEEDYQASIKKAINTGEMNPEAMAVYEHALNGSCQDLQSPDDHPPQFPVVQP